MIDIVKLVQARNPALGNYVLVLRSDARALDGPERLGDAARAWIEAHAPGAAFSRETVALAPYPGGVPAERMVSVLAFKDARHLAAFATAWTADPEPDEAPAA